MHARIYQISLENKCQDDWITEFSITESDMGYLGIDYASPSTSREKDLEWLKECLPTDMFLMEGNEITILNDGTETLTNVFERIKEYVNGIDIDEYVNDMTFFEYRIKAKSRDILDISHLFFTDGWSDYPTYSTEFVRYCHTLKPGTKIYVNGILDYHF